MTDLEACASIVQDATALRVMTTDPVEYKRLSIVIERNQQVLDFLKYHQVENYCDAFRTSGPLCSIMMEPNDDRQ